MQVTGKSEILDVRCKSCNLGLLKNPGEEVAQCPWTAKCEPDEADRKRCPNCGSKLKLNRSRTRKEIRSPNSQDWFICPSCRRSYPHKRMPIS
jgi:uncharacterized protein with PIN domain